MYIKCPKCRSNNVHIIEFWSGSTILWRHGDAFQDGTLEPGDPYRVEGHCQRCNHRWKVRKVTQVNPSWFDSL